MQPVTFDNNVKHTLKTFTHQALTRRTCGQAGFELKLLLRNDGILHALIVWYQNNEVVLPYSCKQRYMKLNRPLLCAWLQASAVLVSLGHNKQSGPFLAKKQPTSESSPRTGRAGCCPCSKWSTCDNTELLVWYALLLPMCQGKNCQKGNQADKHCDA